MEPLVSPDRLIVPRSGVFVAAELATRLIGGWRNKTVVDIFCLLAPFLFVAYAPWERAP